MTSFQRHLLQANNRGSMNVRIQCLAACLLEQLRENFIFSHFSFCSYFKEKGKIRKQNVSLKQITIDCEKMISFVQHLLTRINPV